MKYRVYITRASRGRGRHDVYVVWRSTPRPLPLSLSPPPEQQRVSQPAMPAHSVPDAALLTGLVQRYLHLLKKYPIITKSVTSGVLSALGNLISQALDAKKKHKGGQPVHEFDVHGPVRFAIYGLAVTGPVSHYFYHLLEVLFPAAAPYTTLKRLLLERLVFAPAFLFLFFIVMNALEGKTMPDLQHKVKTRYWTALKMNWKVWTPFQFVNVNYVPVQ
ncbi:hypothetical protein P4O66_005384, partial [Electrophorus voltai]